jgi:DNA-directed RNA polymerase specialized sigma subunit
MLFEGKRMEAVKMIYAKPYLQQIEKIETLIRNKEAEIAQWRDVASGVKSSFPSGERVQSSGNKQKMADMVVRYVDLEREMNEQIDRLIDTRREIIAVLEQLDKTEYNLLHLVYVQYFTLKEAAAIMKRGYSWATTVHGTALKHVRDILDRREEH